MLASFGEKLKVHSIENGQIVEVAEYKHSGNYHCNNITWTGNGKWLVGPIQDEGILPILKFEKNKLSCMRNIVDDNLSAIAHFNCTNKEVIVGSKNGAIYQWDVKEKKISKNVCGSDGKLIKFIEASSDDKYIAACGGYSEKPAIKLFGVTTSRLTNTFELDKCSEISDIKFSPIRNYLGCSTMEGDVILFDLYKNSKIFSVDKGHVGACTGIAMSPINYDVIMSVALSQTLVVHDVRTRTAALKATVNHHLTAVDMLKAEPYAVMGSLDGHLLLFDLRNSNILSDVMVGANRVTAVRTYHDQNSGLQFKDLGINTPEEPVVVTYPLEMSVSELCTPPQPANHVRKSNARLSAGNNSTSYSGRYHSTPNVLSISQDSFVRMLDSPVQNACTASPIHPNGSPTLNLSLSQIKEEEDEDKSNHEIVKELTQVNELPDPSMKILSDILGAIHSLQGEVASQRLESARQGEGIEALRQSMNAMEEKVQMNREVMYRMWSDVERIAPILNIMCRCTDFTLDDQ